MIIKATLSNKTHPEYGQATIPFPIPSSEYDHTIELLESMGIGDTLAQDCRIDQLSSGYPVLNRLVTQSVNVDELDYLAKRMESFCAGEDDQFLAMASKLCLSDIKDFINLTFCCQQATVITDFSDLARVGKDHALTINGGSMISEEYDKVDGQAVALELIQSGAGVVTPYGVVYDNGMKLDQVYDGQHFPAYIYEMPQMMLEFKGSQPEAALGFFYLPSADQQIERTLLRTGIDLEHIRMEVAMDELPPEVSDIIHPNRESLDNLNEMCRAIATLDYDGYRKLGAVVLLARPASASEVRHLAENLDQFNFVPGVENPEQNSQINERGYVAYHGSLTLEELMRDDPAEQYQREPQMGGLAQ